MNSRSFHRGISICYYCKQASATRLNYNIRHHHLAPSVTRTDPSKGCQRALKQVWNPGTEYNQRAENDFPAKKLVDPTSFEGLRLTVYKESFYGMMLIIILGMF